MAEQEHASQHHGPSAMRRFGPLAMGVLIAQIAIAWTLIKVLLSPPEARPLDDEMMALGVPGQDYGKTNVQEERRLPYYYAPAVFRKIVVNPTGTGATRFMMSGLQLGLKAYDRSKSPPDNDVTAGLALDTETLATLDLYATKMRAIVIQVLGTRGLETYERRELAPVQEEIRNRINNEVLRPAFPPDAKRSVEVVEVVFTDMVIQ